MLAEVFLSCYLLRFKGKWDAFACEIDKWIGAFSKVEYEHATNADRAEKCANIGYILARSPIADSFDVLVIREPALRCTTVSNNGDFFGTYGRLESTVGAAAILGTLYYAVDILEMLPDESADAWVLGNAFFFTVQ